VEAIKFFIAVLVPAPQKPHTSEFAFSFHRSASCFTEI